ncbi:LIC10362 family protein [Leptospira alexanderi]|uniref:Uncharacterized protein n=1 Tax=Leptospira alexanderi serovar Manhao 3 str. L 60 TaxID=1049759 RepID=V6HUD7_9LEPT|nr:hypothetical protein [Leptospira alexanderi]EQA60407.1 hypothetical protein LEP1GSC062_0338 [Leptospira alexanderi serovar Manhao 3 str. L 60]
MIYALILTILCGLFFFLSYRLSQKSNALLQKNSKMQEPIVKNTNSSRNDSFQESKFAILKPSVFRSKFQNALRFPFQKESVFLLLSLCVWMLLPLFWGLAFFLKTDANVLVVIGCMIWTYYWLKYLFSTDEAI